MSKFLFVIPTLYMGGAERQVSILANTLTGLGQEVCILKYVSASEEYRTVEGVKVISLAKDWDEYRHISRFRKILFIRKVIKSETPDFVLPFLLEVALAVKIATLGLNVNIFQTILSNPALFPPKKRDRQMMDWLVRFSACTFVQNDTQKNYYDKSIHKKIHVLFNPVDDSFFHIKHRLTESDFVFCAAGRLVSVKNFELLICSFVKAFSKDQPVRLIIYGEGPLRNKLQELIETEGYCGKIHLPGRTNDMAEAYAHADAFVLSSDFEGMPNALIEAMAAGLPCISTDCPTGPSDLIENRISGILVPVQDEAAMSAAMKIIYEDEQFRDMLSMYGRKNIKDVCSAEQIAQQLITICEENR